MARPDISDRLIHLVRADSFEQAFGILNEILESGYLRGSTTNIKGGHQCVCFTEAPLDIARKDLKNLYGGTPYQPFGVMYEKIHVYGLGGRPVIYGPDEDYDLLPETHNWRHVRYEPAGEEPIDWTWEREWRIKQERLNLNGHAVIVVPDEEHASRLLAEHESRQDMSVLEYTQMMEPLLAEQYRDEFPCEIRVLT